MNCNAPWLTPSIPGTKPWNEISINIRRPSFSRYPNRMVAEWWINLLNVIETATTTKNTYSIKPTDAFNTIDFGQCIYHAVVTVLRQLSLGAVLQTQTSFNHPNWIRHDKCQNASFSGSHHMQRRSQWCCRITLLNPCFYGIITAIGKIEINVMHDHFGCISENLQ